MGKKRKDKGSENKENGPEQKICCVPAEKVFCSKPESTEQSSVVKVLCSSGKCPKSGLMHTECFDKWEDLIVGFLAKQGRGRTWSDKQVSLIGAIITFLTGKILRHCFLIVFSPFYHFQTNWGSNSIIS